MVELRNRSRKDCFCAFCRAPRRVYRKKHFTASNVLWSVIAAVCINAIIAGEIDGHALVFFVVVLAVSEVFVHFRWRLSIPCRHCGFDALIYLRDHERATQLVRRHLEKRQEDPHRLLSRYPNLNIPTRRVPKRRVGVRPPNEKGASINP